MGVKKSTVWTSACVLEILYTPASSAVSKPTITFGSCCRANFPSTASSAAGLSLLAQPAALTCSVSRIAFTSDISLILAISNRQIAIGQSNRHRFTQIVGDNSGQGNQAANFSDETQLNIKMNSRISRSFVADCFD